jgi:hypothetical protein
MRTEGRFREKAMAFDARISEFETNRKITVEYVSGPFRGSRKIYQLEPDASGIRTAITHPSEGEFHGSWKLMAFLFRSKARAGPQKSAEDELTKIARAYQGHPRPTPPNCGQGRGTANGTGSVERSPQASPELK